MTVTIELGDGVTARFYGWAPDRELSPEYADRPDIDRAGMIVCFPDGCCGSVPFDLPGVREVIGPDRDVWTVHSLDPETLHVEPSISQKVGPNDGLNPDPHEHHGWIRGGTWVPA